MFAAMKRLVLLVSLVCGLVWLQFSSTGCANIVPPSGGPRDSLAPVLIKADPADSTLNFRGDRIVLNFDEYIDLQDVQNNLLFTPTFNTNPQVEVKLRTITVKLKDTLDPNTTYIFNFGNAIRDINEGNILRDFVYTFSTGPALDSLSFSGQVVLAETGGIDTTLAILLHKNLDDSAVVKERPRYVTRLDRSGRFTFKNLPAGTFQVYALGDAGIVRRYQNKNQTFAFADAPVVISDSTTPVTLYAYKEVPKTSTSTPTVAPTTRQSRGLKGELEKRLRFSTNLTNNQQDLLKDLIISFDQPVKYVDTTKISLTTDTTFSPAAYSATLDSTRRKLTIATTWKEGAKYNLILNRDFAEDSLGYKLLKTDTLFFNARKRSEYGSLTIRFRNVDAAQNPVLQFVQNGQVTRSVSIKNGRFTDPLFIPGDYELRVLFDRNGNGIWDPGDFFGTRRQPELVKPIERKLTVKAAWDNDTEVTLPSLN